MSQTKSAGVFLNVLPNLPVHVPSPESGQTLAGLAFHDLCYSFSFGLYTLETAFDQRTLGSEGVGAGGRRENSLKRGEKGEGRLEEGKGRGGGRGASERGIFQYSLCGG